MSREYVEISKGTVCQIEKAFNFPTYTCGDSLFADQELLKDNELGQLVFLPPFHQECHRRHYDTGLCPMEEIPCEEFKLELLPLCKDMSLASISKFMVRINDSPFYVAHLCGTYYTRDCHIIAPAEMHFSSKSSFSQYKLPDNNYVIKFNNPFGTITSIESAVQVWEKPYYGVDLCSNSRAFTYELPKALKLFKDADIKIDVKDGIYTIINYEPHMHISYYDFENWTKTNVNLKGKRTSRPIYKPPTPSTPEIENPIHTYAFDRLDKDLRELIEITEDNMKHYSDDEDRVSGFNSELLQLKEALKRFIINCEFPNLEIVNERQDGNPCGCCDGVRSTVYEVTSDGLEILSVVQNDSETRFAESWTAGDSGYVIWKIDSVDLCAEPQMDESDGAGPPSKETSLPDNISAPTPVNSVSSEEIIDGIQTEQHDQAIDSTREIVGINSSHTVTSVPTPSGVVEAIDLSVVQGTVTVKPDYLPGIHLPDYVNRWMPGSIETTTNGIIYTPTFSERIMYFSELFTYYHTNVVWKIVSKPPLFQSQRFWVSFNPTINGTPLALVSDNDLAGFEWNPSENNEIYVVTPWSSINYMDPLETPSLGQLIITSRTDLVTEEGLPAPLPIDVYCAPLNMNLYLPKVVNPASAIDAEMYAIQKELFGDGSGDEFTLTITGNPQFLVISASGQGGDIIQDDEGTLYSSSGANFLQRVVSGNIRYTLLGNVKILFFSGLPFTVDGDVSKISAYISSNYATNSQTLERQDNDSLIFMGIASSLTNDASVTLNGSTILTYSNSDTTTMATSDPTIGSGEVVFENWEGIVQSLVLATPQMDKFGHNYNDHSSLPNTTLGYIGDHTSRIDNQWGFISSTPIEAISTQVVIDLNSPSTLFPYYDRDRHLFYYRYPKIKFVSSSNPSTNLLVRITQTTSSTPIPPIDAFQLPGTEWDLKDGAKIIQPYWDKELIALYPTEDTCYLQIDVLGGTIGTTPFISTFYNTADMEYFHFVGLTPDTLFDIRAAPTDAVPQMKVTMETPVGNLPSSASASRTENSFRYVTTLTIDPTTGAVNIPVNSRLFGPWNSKHFGRYGKFRGNLKIKLVVTSNRLVNGNIHLIHHNSSITGALDTSKMLAVLGDIGHSMNGAPGSAIELELDWRTQTPFLPIDFSTNNPDNGYLTIVIPQTSSLTDVSKLVCTLYVDVSGIQVDLPRSIEYSGSYQPISPSIIARA